MVVLSLIFWGTAVPFSILAIPTHILTNSVQGFSFLPILANTYYLLSFLIKAAWAGVRWYLIAVLICIFLTISDVEHPFMYLLVMCVSSYEKCPCKSFAHCQIRWSLLILILLWSCYWVVWVPYIFWILTPYQIYVLQIFSPIPWVAFSFCWLCLLMSRSALVWCNPICLFLLLLPTLLVSYPKSYCQDQSQEVY